MRSVNMSTLDTLIDDLNVYETTATTTSEVVNVFSLYICLPLGPPMIKTWLLSPCKTEYENNIRRKDSHSRHLSCQIRTNKHLSYQVLTIV